MLVAGYKWLTDVKIHFPIQETEKKQRGPQAVWQEGAITSLHKQLQSETSWMPEQLLLHSLVRQSPESWSGCKQSMRLVSV